MGELRFQEEMSGYVGAGEQDANPGYTAGRHADTPLRFRLEIAVDDVDAFVADPRHLARATGWVEGPLVGGRRPVLPGSTFNLFVEQAGERNTSRMLYRLLLEDAGGAPMTLSGFKVIHDDPGFDVWADTTVLRTRLLRGHLDPAGEDAAGADDVLAAGLLEISFGGFLRLLASMQGGVADRARFGALFMGELWKVYGGRAGLVQDAFADPTPGVFHEPPSWEALRARGVHSESVPFRAGDGLPLRLAHFRGDDEPTKGPVMLVAGTGVRAAIFSSAPQQHTTVDALVKAGYDVWAEDWRASIDFPPRSYTLDQAAVFDHPAAVQEIKARTGADTIKALVHCQGSTSFTMSALAGLVDDVRTVVSNAVSLHPRVTPLSRVKLEAMVPVASRLLDGVDPQWAVRAPTPLRAALAKWVHVVRHDCNEPACAMSTYIYGYGPDVLWRHANLDPATHHWVAREFGYVPFAFFRQILHCVRAGHLVPVEGFTALPASFDDASPPPGQVWTFIAGSRNMCFLPAGQTRSLAWFRERSRQDHTYVPLEGYSHLDVFFGRDAARETFPAILAGLEREPA